MTATPCVCSRDYFKWMELSIPSPAHTGNKCFFLVFNSIIAQSKAYKRALWQWCYQRGPEWFKRVEKELDKTDNMCFPP
jgi:hypothetical protein